MPKKKLSVSVIVANHGRDTSALRATLPKYVEYIEIDEGKERSIQRNKGIRKAKGDILIILDSDQVLSKGAVNEIRNTLSSGKATCLYIPEVILAEGYWGKVRKFEREFYTATRIDVPRAVLAEFCPKFDASMSGPEDADWGNRIPGLRGVTKHVLYHHDNIGLGEYFRKKRYYSRSMERYRQKWPDDPILKARYRCWQVFTEDGKWRKLVRHPKLVIGILFIIAIRGVIYVTRKKT